MASTPRRPRRPRRKSISVDICRDKRTIILPTRGGGRQGMVPVDGKTLGTSRLVRQETVGGSPVRSGGVWPRPAERCTGSGGMGPGSQQPVTILQRCCRRAGRRRQTPPPSKCHHGNLRGIKATTSLHLQSGTIRLIHPSSIPSDGMRRRDGM